jgi:hypothetical protein
VSAPTKDAGRVIPDFEAEEPPTWFRNSYRCDQCGEGWEDEWDCACNDRCPKCNAEIEPFESEEIGE